MNQNNMENVFLGLSPPKPSIKKYDASGHLKVVYNMSNYYNVSGGCIHADCDVAMADGSTLKVKSLRKGSLVQGLSGPVAVKCVIETKVNETVEMVEFPSGLIITKYHPVYL
jgi:hypothetical protein